MKKTNKLLKLAVIVSLQVSFLGQSMSHAAAIATTVTKKTKTNFAALIEENKMAQENLHQKIQKNVYDSRLAAKKDKNKVIIVQSGAINSPTDDNFLKYEKEKRQIKPSNRLTEERLAEEIQEAE